MSTMYKILASSLPYNRTKIQNKLEKLNVQQNGLLVSTSYDNNLMKETEVSNKYYTFDFPNFTKNIIPVVENYFTPTNYTLKFKGGRQELRLIGEETKINGETFYKMLSILNSTDKSRALQLNIGLLRLICTNGLFASIPGQSSSIKSKHFKSTLPEKIEHFTTGIKQFASITSQQKDILASLLGHNISLRQLANALVRNSDNEVIPSKLKKLKRLTGKLLTSNTDRLNNLTEEQRNLLIKPELILYSKTSGDLDIDKYNVLNAYTEIYRNTDSGKIKRESNKIIGILNAN